MVKDNVVEFPDRFETEIALAERAHDLILERMARGRLPNELAQGGDVAPLLEAVGELLYLNALEADGRRISQKNVEATVARLESAVARIAAWPEASRLLVLAPLVEALDELELEWIAMVLTSLLSDPDSLGAFASGDEARAFRRILVVRVRILIEDNVWHPDFETLLRSLHRRWLDEPEVEDLHLTLKRGVIFHAIFGRQSLLEARRRRMADLEPLPDDLVEALEDLCTEVISSELVRWSLHLVLADAVAAGLVPDWAQPRQVVAAAELAIIDRDEPDLDLDLMKLARWARLKPKTLRTLRDTLAPALDWAPPGFDGSAEGRRELRWMIESGPTDLWPARWTPEEDAEGLPPYSLEAAYIRLEELREVAWMMIDGLEALQFVTGAVRFGGDAPDEMDVEIVHALIEVWKEERLVGFDRDEDGEDSDDDGCH